MKGKEVARKFKVFERKRGPGTDREWFNARRYYSTTGPTTYPPWKPWVNPNNCQDCGKLRHPLCGQNSTRPTCWNCKQCHLTEDCTYGTRSLKELQEQQERDRQYLERERKRLIDEEEERVAA